MKKISVFICLFCSICFIQAQNAVSFIDQTAKPDQHANPDNQQPPPAFIFVEETATFQGGDLTDFRKWVQENLVYPEEDLENNIFGEITVQFVVSETGEVTDVNILRGVTPTMNEEVKRVLLSSPAWEPAKQAGKVVRQQFTITVVFTLSDNE